MKIGVAYNLKDELSPLAALNSEYNEEFDAIQTIDAICNVFEKNNFQTTRLQGSSDIIDKLKREKVDFVFNIAEGHYGRNRESYIPSILEMLNIPYSGSDPLTLGLTLDKIVTKKIAQHAQIPVPSYGVVKRIKDIYDVDNNLQYPMITKPAWEGSSKGIYSLSKVSDKEELERNVESLLEKYPNQPVLVEEYIEGREITVGVTGNDCPQVLGLMEIVDRNNPGKDFFYSLEVKRDWRNLVEYVLPPDISQSLDTQIRRCAVVVFKEFGCRDIARIDFRISGYNEIFLLEINPLPGLAPESGDLVIMAQKLGIGYEGLILTILRHAFSRYGLIEALKGLSRVV